MIKQMTMAVVMAFVLIAMLYTDSDAVAHGKVSLEEDSCMRQIGENMIHLSTYQPQYDEAGHYCTEIPLAGDAYLVVDLIDSALRNMPVSIKVVKGSDKEGETVTHLQANYYPDGVISGISKLEKGQYLVYVTAEGIPPLNFHYKLRVEMIDYLKVIRASIAPTMALIILAWIILKIARSQRVRSWWTSRRSK